MIHYNYNVTFDDMTNYDITSYPMTHYDITCNCLLVTCHSIVCHVHLTSIMQNLVKYFVIVTASHYIKFHVTLSMYRKYSYTRAYHWNQWLCLWEMSISPYLYRSLVVINLWRQRVYNQFTLSVLSGCWKKIITLWTSNSFVMINII